MFDRLKIGRYFQNLNSKIVSILMLSYSCWKINNIELSMLANNEIKKVLI